MLNLSVLLEDTARLPMGRLGTPEEYASLAVYLAGDNHYLTGQIISPNGGAVI
ncbi:SDR family oxidoreductase [Nocardia sp. NPDC059246]|uniref:SDR family oxidoreductase n=1 Tax=unclassified Nocardia TaxID=2637762 RepID=UPI0036B6792A